MRENLAEKFRAISVADPMSPSFSGAVWPLLAASSSQTGCLGPAVGLILRFAESSSLVAKNKTSSLSGGILRRSKTSAFITFSWCSGNAAKAMDRFDSGFVRPPREWGKNALSKRFWQRAGSKFSLLTGSHLVTLSIAIISSAH